MNCCNFSLVYWAWQRWERILLQAYPLTSHAFETSHIFRIMYARILKFHVCIAYEKLPDSYFFFFFLVRFCTVELWPLLWLRHFSKLANENLVSKISKKPLELGSWNFAANQGSLSCLSLKRGIIWTNIYETAKVNQFIFTMITDDLQNSIAVISRAHELMQTVWNQCVDDLIKYWWPFMNILSNYAPFSDIGILA